MLTHYFTALAFSCFMVMEARLQSIFSFSIPLQFSIKFRSGELGVILLSAESREDYWSTILHTCGMSRGTILREHHVRTSLGHVTTSDRTSVFDPADDTDHLLLFPAALSESPGAPVQTCPQIPHIVRT